MENGNAGNQGKEWAQGAPDFEQLAETAATPEVAMPGVAMPGVEQRGERQSSPERAALERLGQMTTDGGASVMPPLPPMDGVVADTGTVDDDNPDTAEDGEKIEKEWAARIRKIVELTKDNPRTEQIEVNKLKADYMKKRFNRELGDRN